MLILIVRFAKIGRKRPENEAQCEADNILAALLVGSAGNENSTRSQQIFSFETSKLSENISGASLGSGFLVGM
jgi:hypothetical protein